MGQQGAGHNVQLLDFINKRIANIESAGELALVTHIPAGSTPLFHANM